jgi:hypothetical protein
MTSRTFARAAAACAVTAALGAGTALPAAQAHPKRDRDHYGYVRVCQYVKYADDYKDYDAKYSVRDEKSYYDFYLSASYPCHQVKVHKGWVNVRVVHTPDYTKLYGSRYQNIYVDKGEYETVRFNYRAVSY